MTFRWVYWPPRLGVTNPTATASLPLLGLEMVLLLSVWCCSCLCLSPESAAAMLLVCRELCPFSAGPPAPRGLGPEPSSRQCTLPPAEQALSHR